MITEEQKKAALEKLERLEARNRLLNAAARGAADERVRARDAWQQAQQVEAAQKESYRHAPTNLPETLAKRLAADVERARERYTRLDAEFEALQQRWQAASQRAARCRDYLEALGIAWTDPSQTNIVSPGGRAA